ncbi:hypothetical protein R0K18_15240 [Pantoea sp. SIMBA_133]
MSLSENFIRHLIQAATACALIMSSAAYASPQIDVGDWYEFMPSSRSTLTKTVTNSGSSTAYVSVSAQEVFARNGYAPDPGAAKAGTPAADTLTTGLVVSPSRLIIPKGMRQTVRLLAGGERSQERYFRVSFIPVIPSEKDRFGLDDRQIKDAAQGAKAGVAVLTGYGIMVTVAPDSARYQTQVQRTPQGWTVTNNGNATVRLLNPKTCQAGKCSYESSMHIRPGNNLTFTADGGRSYTFRLKEGERETPKSLTP